MPHPANSWQPSRPLMYRPAHSYDSVDINYHDPWAAYSTGHLESFDHVRNRTHERDSWNIEASYYIRSDSDQAEETLPSCEEVSRTEDHSRDLLTPTSTNDENEVSQIPHRQPFEDKYGIGNSSGTSDANRVGERDYAEIVNAFRALRKSRAVLSYQMLRQREQGRFVARKRDYTADLIAQLQQQFEAFNRGDEDGLNTERIRDLFEAIKTATVECSKAEDTLAVITDAVAAAEEELKIKEEQQRFHLDPDESPGAPPVMDGILDFLSLPEVLQADSSSSDASSDYQIQVQLSSLGQQLLRDALCSPLFDPTGLFDIGALLDQCSSVSSTSSARTSIIERSDREIELPKIEGREKGAIDTEVVLFGEQFHSKRPRSPSAVSSKDLLLSSTASQRQKRETDCCKVIADAVATVEKVEPTSHASSLSFRKIALPPSEQIERFWDVGRRSWLDFSRLLRHIEVFAEAYGKSFKFLKKLDLLAIDQLLGEIQNAGSVPSPQDQWNKTFVRSLTSGDIPPPSQPSGLGGSLKGLSYYARLQSSTGARGSDVDADVKRRPHSEPTLPPPVLSTSSIAFPGAGEVYQAQDKLEMNRRSTSLSCKAGSRVSLEASNPVEVNEETGFASHESSIPREYLPKSSLSIASSQDVTSPKFLSANVARLQHNLLCPFLPVPGRPRSEPGQEIRSTLPTSPWFVRKSSTH